MDRWNEFIKLYNRFRFDEIPKMEGTIYHYTSPEGLKGIFDSKALYATDMYFLNDSNEGIYILDLIKENINKLCKENARLINLVQKELRRIELEKWDELIHSYTISFSCNGDSLEMWNYYTKGNSVQGYNIGFDVQKLMESIHIEILDEKGNPIQRNSEKHLVLFHGKVIYDKEKQMEIITTIFEAFYDKYQEINDEQMLDLVAHYMVSKALNYGQFFKQKEFEVEEEYRFIFATSLMEGRNNSELGIPFSEQFRVYNGCLIPYQKCKFDIESIANVTFSPSLHNEMSEAGLSRLLHQYGITGEDTIKKSNIPLRF